MTGKSTPPSNTSPSRGNSSSRPFSSAPNVPPSTCLREEPRRSTTTSSCMSVVYSSWTTARISCLSGCPSSREWLILRIFLSTFLVRLFNKTRFFVSSRRTWSRNVSRCSMTSPKTKTPTTNSTRRSRRTSNWASTKILPTVPNSPNSFVTILLRVVTPRPVSTTTLAAWTTSNPASTTSLENPNALSKLLPSSRNSRRRATKSSTWSILSMNTPSNSSRSSRARNYSVPQRRDSKWLRTKKKRRPLKKPRLRLKDSASS
mmetsp:Transcript_13081/g.27727  ORF Transcript_13081/g.27727 Transcript_13081/m.27727 type:complete len:260 (+) Transcript_13081:153-932(+)